MEERKYIAISIKHSDGLRFTLWGQERTEDHEKRCLSGYLGTMDFDKCELYSLKDFQDSYGNGIIKCDEPVKMTIGLVKKWKKLDTVLVDYEEYKKFVSFID